MADENKHVIRTAELPAESAVRVKHPFNPKSEIFMHRLSDRVGMKRAHLSLARVPPGKESFIPHSHSMQEEFLFILAGEGLAEIDEDMIRVGPGDYMGFPIDGATHHLINIGTSDLVYLMGGERTETEVASFPTLGKIGVFNSGMVSFFEESAGQEMPVAKWIVDADKPAT
jgi:uncharacterized cupin superfamily protein